MNYSSIKKALVIAALCLLSFAPQVVNAQKVAHLNFQELVTLMPEYQNAATEYELYQAEIEDRLKTIENDAMTQQKLYEAESKKPTPNKTKLASIQKYIEILQQDYSETQQTAQDSLKAKMAELVAPIRTKVEEAVAVIAKEQGYSHVIDNTYGTLIYADPLFDISELVKKKLNIKPKPVANPGAGKPGTTPVSPR